MAAAATANPAAQAQWRPRVNPWIIAASVALAAFMEVLDTSIANVALPHIAGDLGASGDESTWVLTSYLVSNAIVLPMGGWAASVIGRKNFFMLCIVIFTVSSFLCGIASSLGLLLLFRVFQGAGGGGLQPMAQAIMADSFEPSKRGMAFALYGVVAVLAPSIGPALGGWITDNYSWHWIFYINIPVGILAFILTSRVVDDPPFAKSDRKNFFKLDYVGLGFLVVAMGSLQVALDKGEENDWFGSTFIRGFAIAFVISFAGLMIWEWYKKDPLIDIRLFKFKNFAVCCFLMLLTGGFLNATTVLQPQFLQQTIGYTATNAGFSLTAGGIALLFMVVIAGRLLGIVAARNVIIFGFVLFTIGYYFSAKEINLGISFNTAQWLRVLQVIGIPFVFIAVTTAAYFGIPSEKNNQVSGLINFARNIGGSILISVTNAIVTESGLWHQNQMRKYLTPTDPAFHNRVNALKDVFTTSAGKGNAETLAQGQIYNQLNQQATALGYVDVFWVLCVAAIVMILLTFLLDTNNPQDQKGKVVME